MSQALRLPEILEIARRDGKVSVDGLAAHFGVTLQTVRRDLSELADTGHLVRVHGGAVLPSGITNIVYEERRALNHAGKQEIARACAAEVPNNISVFLSIGTTTEAVARALLHHENLLIVTNNINVANILSANPSCEVIVTGGQLRPEDGGLTGNLAVQTVRQFKFDLAIIGCSALDVEGDLLDFDMQEVAVSQAALIQSRKAFVMADHTKLARHAPMRIGSLADVDAVFTDAELPYELVSACHGWGTRVVLCEGGLTGRT